MDPRHTTGQYLSPVEFRKALEDDDTVIIDARNDYEFDLGHFRGAIRHLQCLEICLTGLKRIKRYLQIKKWLRTVLVAFDAKNFLDGF
ncbi:rhodanese-like domain-containing protein [Staphylococcus aureus]